MSLLSTLGENYSYKEEDYGQKSGYYSGRVQGQHQIEQEYQISEDLLESRMGILVPEIQTGQQKEQIGDSGGEAATGVVVVDTHQLIDDHQMIDEVLKGNSSEKMATRIVEVKIVIFLIK